MHSSACPAQRTSAGPFLGASYFIPVLAVRIAAGPLRPRDAAVVVLQSDGGL